MSDPAQQSSSVVVPQHQPVHIDVNQDGLNNDQNFYSDQDVSVGQDINAGQDVSVDQDINAGQDVSVGQDLNVGQDINVPAPVSLSNQEQSFNNVLDVLVAQQLLSDEQSQQVQMESLSSGKEVTEIVIEKNMVSEDQLYVAKATFFKIPFVKIEDYGVDPQALSQLGESVAKNYKMFPIIYDKIEGILHVAMTNPLDLQAIDFAKQKTGLNIIASYATPTDLERALAENYSQSLSNEVTAALEQSGQFAAQQMRRQKTTQSVPSDIRQAPVAKIVQTIVSFAMKSRSSDIHIEPQENRTRVRYRIDGILAEKLVLPISVHDSLVSRIKILSGLKIDEKRTPQDGRFNYQEEDQEVDLRVSTLPTTHGEKIVMRLLKKDDNVPDLPALGMTGSGLEWVKKAIQVPHGIVLITGPTGSGKTTTLYSILNRINSPQVNIMTLEDPVEYQMPGINQVQVNPQAGLTFASGLRSFLRQDPNIIMVGEIRDSETSELAVQASLTGHLVFSTLHTSSAAGAIPRLLDMGVEPFLLASSLTLVMAQRVLRCINPDFKERYKPDPVVIEDIKKVLGPLFDQWCEQNNTNPENLELSRPSHNIPQGETEYKGRRAIFEVINITENVGNLILKSSPAVEIEKLALQNGTLLMKQDGYFKALEGITTIEEVKRVAEI